MKVHDWPKVLLVARPSIVWDGVGELLAEYGLPNNSDGWRRDVEDSDGDSLPELMGRLCYGSFGTNQGRVGARNYIGNILSSGHGSVLEHANWSFVVCRAGRGYTHQQVRHRSGFAYSQESTHFIRYGDEGEKGIAEAAVCVTGLNEAGKAMMVAGTQAALRRYEELWIVLRRDFDKDAKVKKIVSGAARGMLPNGIESRLGITANARALRHFCELRGNADNTLEIRLVAAQLAEIMMVEAPAIFQDFQVSPDEDGYPLVSSDHRKV